MNIYIGVMSPNIWWLRFQKIKLLEESWLFLSAELWIFDFLELFYVIIINKLQIITYQKKQVTDYFGVTFINVVDNRDMYPLLENM